MNPRIKVIAVGNPFRGDDAVGLVVGEALRRRAVPGITVFDSTGEGTALMELWHGNDRVVLVDAVRSGAGSGAVHRIDALETSLPSDFFHYSTHAFSVAEAVELARALGELPPSFIIYGIEGRSFETGTPLSPCVHTSALEVADRVVEDVMLLRTESYDAATESVLEPVSSRIAEHIWMSGRSRR